MKALLIAGGGKFGKKEMEFAKDREYHTIIIDNNPKCLASKYVHGTFNKFEDLLKVYHNSAEPKLFLLLNNISVINKILLETEIQFEYVIPVVPIHLTALIIKRVLKEDTYELIPDEDLCSKSVHDLENNIMLNHNCEKGVVYLSYAKRDETCPDDCPGPKKYCPNFDREKPITITKYVRKFYNVSNTFNLLKQEGRLVINIHSFQLKPGLGGIKGDDLYMILSKLSKNLENIRKSRIKFIIATTCNCHGVLNYFKALNS